MHSTFSPTERVGLAREFLQTTYNWWLQKDGAASILIDKTPRYFKILPFLSSVFAKARFIFLTRNPLDVAGSHKARWEVDLRSLVASGSWDTAFDVFCSPRLIADAQEQLAERCYSVRYEDLVTSTEPVLAAVFEFLGVPFESTYLHYLNEDPRTDAHRTSPMGDKVLWSRTSISPESVDTWKSRLDEDEVSLLAGTVGRDVFERLGYDMPPVGADRPELRQRLFSTLHLRLNSSAPSDEDVSSTNGNAGATAEELPRISIITPSFNQARWIEETILSVASQNYPDIEHIIVDGGSSDETAAIVAKYPHVRFIQEPDHGQSHAINKGILASSGQILAYLNSDDLYRPDAFRCAAQALSDTHGEKIIVGNCDRIDSSGQIIGHLRANFGGYSELQRYWRWDRTYCMPQQAVFWRRSVTEHVGLFDTACHYSMDYDMWMRILANYTVRVIDETLAAFRFHEDSKTVSQTDSMYVEHLEVARRYWPSAWSPRRWLLEIVGCHTTGKGLLDIAEHVALSDRDDRLPMTILARALGYWPPLALCPRAVLSLVTASSRGRRWSSVVQRIHREYLSVRYRIGRMLWNRDKV